MNPLTTRPHKEAPRCIQLYAHSAREVPEMGLEDRSHDWWTRDYATGPPPHTHVDPVGFPVILPGARRFWRVTRIMARGGAIDLSRR